MKTIAKTKKIKMPEGLEENINYKIYKVKMSKKYHPGIGLFVRIDKYTYRWYCASYFNFEALNE